MNAEHFLLFTLVLARVGGLVATAPIFGTSSAPARVRAVLAVALAALVTPAQWHAAVAYPGSILNYAVLLGSEAIIGTCLGLAVMILVHAMSMAGELVGFVSGLSLADAFDPDMQENVPHFSRLMFLVTIAVFLCIGGHRMVMAALLDTFQTIPPGSCGVPFTLADTFATLVTQSFSLAIRAAAPAITALLLATIALGLISRTLPQLNIMAVGFGLNAMLAFAALGLTLGAAAWAFQDQVEPALETILEALRTPARPEWLS